VKSPEFVEKRQTPSGTYEVYRSNNAESARSFLASKTVDQAKYYIKVETPEGNWGVDIDGLYLEKLAPFQKNVDSAQCQGVLVGMPSASSLQYAANGIADNFVVAVRCGNCGKEWKDGVRFRNANVVRCPNCRSFNKVDSTPHIKDKDGSLLFSIKI